MPRVTHKHIAAPPPQQSPPASRRILRRLAAHARPPAVSVVPIHMGDVAVVTWHGHVADPTNRGARHADSEKSRTARLGAAGRTPRSRLARVLARGGSCYICVHSVAQKTRASAESCAEHARRRASIKGSLCTARASDIGRDGGHQNSFSQNREMRAAQKI